jgi:hypothetical protein
MGRDSDPTKPKKEKSPNVLGIRTQQSLIHIKEVRPWGHERNGPSCEYIQRQTLFGCNVQEVMTDPVVGKQASTA